MGESKRTTMAFSLCKLTQTVRLSTSQGDCHFLVFLMNSTQERKKNGRNTQRQVKNGSEVSLSAISSECFYRTFWKVVIFTKLCLKKTYILDTNIVNYVFLVYH